jgi:hypothetical protein
MIANKGPITVSLAGRSSKRMTGERMKRSKEHVVPLSSDAGALVFPVADGKLISNAPVWELSNQLSEGRATTHGFRYNMAVRRQLAGV